jgi:catechol 2,3-dioxygenase-like lactoylglutathione lyase family enzyme
VSGDLADARLYTVRIFARDWPAMTAFYREELGLHERTINAGIGWSEYDVGGPTLAIERIDPEDPESDAYAGRFLGVSLEVDDVEEVYQALTSRGVTFVGPPARQPWGGVLAHLSDPEGNVITLIGS